MEDNSKSLETINKMLDEKIITAAKTIIRNQNNLSNELLKQLAEELGVEQINWYNANGETIYSNVDKYLGWTALEGHPIYDFMVSSNNELIEEVRQDSESGAFLKYGYLKSDDGSFVQVGIIADRVHDLTERSGYQKLLKNLSDLKWGILLLIQMAMK